MDEVAEYERRFRRSGLPLFIEDYSASTDIFNRAVPLLGLVFMAEMLGAIQLDWSLAANVAAALGGLAILLIAIGVSNRFRGRPFRSIPQTVGAAELAAFVIVPALLPLIFGGQAGSALVTALANAGILAAIYGVVGYGLLSILRWVMARLLGQLAASLSLLTRAVPLLMIFSVVLFLTVEVWEVFSSVPWQDLVVIGSLFVALGAVFLIARLPREVRELEHDVGDTGAPLDRRQRLNVGLVMFVGQSVVVLLVSVLVGAFFVAFGLLAVDEAVLRSWVGHGGNVLVTVHLPWENVELTEELLRVSGGIAAFTGLYFAIAMLTDSTYREEFLSELTSEMRESFRARAEYLNLVPNAKREASGWSGS